MDDQYKTTDKWNRFDEDGREILNPTPVSPPLGYRKTPSLSDQIREQVLALHRLEKDFEPETEEEADDFDIDDDPAPVSRWENDMVPSIKELRRLKTEMEENERVFARPKQTQQQEKEGASAPSKKPTTDTPSQ